MSGLVFGHSRIAAVLAIARRARAQSRSDGARARNRNEPQRERDRSTVINLTSIVYRWCCRVERRGGIRKIDYDHLRNPNS
jgi:hypothetical protein